MVVDIILLIKSKKLHMQNVIVFQSLVSDTEKGGKASNGDAGGADGDHLVVSSLSF